MYEIGFRMHKYKKQQDGLSIVEISLIIDITSY